MMNRRLFSLCPRGLLPAFVPSALKAIEFPGRRPGVAVAVVEPRTCRLENTILSLSWQVTQGRLRPGSIIDRLGGRTIPGGSEVFSVVLSDGRTIPASGMKLLRPPRSEKLAGGCQGRAGCPPFCRQVHLGHLGHRRTARWKCSGGRCSATATTMSARSFPCRLAARTCRWRKSCWATCRPRGPRRPAASAVRPSWPATCFSPAKTPWPTTKDGQGGCVARCRGRPCCGRGRRFVAPRWSAWLRRAKCVAPFCITSSASGPGRISRSCTTTPGMTFLGPNA